MRFPLHCMSKNVDAIYFYRSIEMYNCRPAFKTCSAGHAQHEGAEDGDYVDSDCDDDDTRLEDAVTAADRLSLFAVCTKLMKWG